MVHTTGPDRPHEPTAHPDEAINIIELVADARRGKRSAWTTLVERYWPLIRTVARGYKLNEDDVEDVGQIVCLCLIQHLGSIREPRALPGWIVTTTRRESLRLIRSHRQAIPVDPVGDAMFGITTEDSPGLDANLLRAEAVQAVRDGLAHLPQTRRDLLLLLSEDQPLSYRDISELLAIPIGSIGPTRARSLACLQATPPIRNYHAA
jgi:RNA polymerase sigma factor (sigma-70 family)